MATTTFNSDIGRTQFLQLLATQLQYQNPLEPVQQQDLLSQMAQFSTLDGIEQMNTRFDDLIQLQSLSQGADIVGRQVEYLSEISGEKKTGPVAAAQIVDHKLVLKVNNELVPIAQVVSVLADSAAV